jgi:NADP-dependent 3-hydroxy acid dehydrogenase YdfG
VLDPDSVAAAVRVAVDLPKGGTVESLTIRPTRIR